jgi:tripartite-type tricarboxylate transporter receptor subunit TctC
MLARLFAHGMTEGLGPSVVVENVGGAGGSLGADQVAKAAPDGYTLLFHNITFTTTTSSLQFVGRSKHDIEQDFVPNLGRRLCAAAGCWRTRRCRRESEGIRGLRES